MTPQWLFVLLWLGIEAGWWLWKRKEEFDTWWEADDWIQGR